MKNTKLIVLLIIFQTHLCFAERQESEAQEWKKLPSLRKTSGTEEEMQKEFLVLEMKKDCRDVVDKAAKNYSHSPELIDEAIEKLDKLAADYPDLEAGVSALFWKADLLMLRSDHGGASEVFQEIAERYHEYPESIEARVRWAEQLIVMEKPEEAVNVLEAVKDVGKDKPIPSPFPLRYELLIRLSETYFRSGMEDKGKQILAETTQEFPKKAEEIQRWYENCIVPLSPEGALVVWTRNLLDGPLALSGLEENNYSGTQVNSEINKDTPTQEPVKEPNTGFLIKENAVITDTNFSSVQPANEQATTNRSIIGNIHLKLIIAAFSAGIFCLLFYVIWKKRKTA